MTDVSASDYDRGTATFPSMPPYDPARPDDEQNWPDIRISDDSVTLTYHDHTVTLPGIGIEKHSIEIHPGYECNVNRVTLTLFACRVDVDDNNRDDVAVIHERRITGGTLRALR